MFTLYRITLAAPERESHEKRVFIKCSSISILESWKKEQVCYALK